MSELKLLNMFELGVQCKQGKITLKVFSCIPYSICYLLLFCNKYE